MEIDIGRRAVLLVAVGVLVTGCASSGDGDEHATTRAPASTGSSSAPRSSGKPLASETGETAVYPGGKVDIDAMSMRVSEGGKLMVLTLRFTPHLPAGSEDRPRIYDLIGQTPLKSFEPALVDTVNLKRYSVVKDDQENELKSDDISTVIANNHSGLATYTFAAPPANVTEMNVHVDPWQPFSTIPVQR
jgi:hypothetical protein